MASDILVVDDEVFIRNMLRMYLETQGFVVLLASDGEKALESFQGRREEIDLVLMDVRMPGMNGLETLMAMQKLGAVRCCFMTGDLGTLTVSELLDRGALHLFQKPLILGEMVQVLHRLMRVP